MCNFELYNFLSLTHFILSSKFRFHEDNISLLTSDYDQLLTTHINKKLFFTETIKQQEKQ